MTKENLNIEINAQDYSNTFKDSDYAYKLGIYDGYIKGAKSDAAKLYWFNLFKKNLNNNMKDYSANH